MKQELQRDLDILAGTEIFKGLTGEEILKLMELMDARVVEYAKGESIHYYGDTAKGMEILLEGTAIVEVDDAEGKKTNLNMITRGGEFGAVLTISDRARGWMRVYAATHCRVMRFDILRVCHESVHSPEEFRLINNLLHSFADKCVNLYQKVYIYGQKRIRSRVRTFLMEQIGDSDEIVLPMNRTQLAEYLGVDRTALARELTRMQEDGIIRVNKRRVKLLDREFFHLDDARKASASTDEDLRLQP